MPLERVKSVKRESAKEMAEMMKKWLALAYEKNDVIECRILRVGDPKGKYFPTYAGYYEYDELNKLVSDLAAYISGLTYAEGVYTTLNPVNPDLLARSANQLKQTREATTSDNEIRYRQWLPIDCDPVRPGGISSTDKELESSLIKAKEIRDFLVSEYHFPLNSFVYAQSGNGAHLVVRIETLENNDDSKILISNCLKALSEKFSDNLVKIDTTVYNASRIWKLYGSLARKGDSLPERPHRYAKILESPEKADLIPCPKELLEKLASLAPVNNKTYSLPAKTSNYQQNNIVSINNKNSVSSQSILDRAKKYLSYIPGAISGQNGHQTTYFAASVLINGFNLPFNDAFSLLSEWNNTCQPPWDDNDLTHKLNDADKNGSIKPKGYLLNINENKMPNLDADKSSDFSLKEINAKDLKVNNLIRIRGKGWIGKVTKINNREITVYFKNKNELVTFDISQLLWKDDKKNLQLSLDVLHTTTTTVASDDKTPAIEIDDFVFLMNEFKQSVERYINDNETGDAQLFSELFQNELVFDHSEESWFLYKKHYWVKDKKNKSILFALEKQNEYYKKRKIELNRCISKANTAEDKAYIEQLIKEIEQRIHSLNTRTRASSVLKIAESKLTLPENKNWNSNAFLLPVKNGVLDLKTGKLRDGKPKDFFRTFAPVKWKGINEPCPRFEKFLEEIFENKPNRKEIIDTLQRLFGYGITGLSTEHIFPIFIGEGGRNGKDTLFETLGYVLGDFASTADRDCLIEGRRDVGSATPYLRELESKRIVWVSETKKGSRLNTSQVKYITGGGKIKARRLNENLVEFEPTHLMCLLTNDKPHVTAEDNAIWERIMLISFDLSFVDNPVEASQRKKDPHLKEVLRKEASGILAWLVRGCLDWQKQGLNIPNCMREEKNEYKNTEDTIGLFLNDCCVIDNNSNVSASQLYDAYVEWSKRNNLSIINGKDFGLRMTKRLGQDKKVRTKKGILYNGIRLEI